MTKVLSYIIDKHRGQTDDEGKPYIQHVKAVAMMVKLFTNEENIINAAYLHDVLEETDTSYEELRKIFGKKTADLVLELTHTKNKSKGSYFPKLESRWAIIIKLCDRAHNLSRMNSWNNKKRKLYLRRSRFWKKSEDDPIRSYQ